MKPFLIVLLFSVTACSTATKFDSQKIRPWNVDLSQEYPNQKAVIAHYRKGGSELFYLAARHSSAMSSDTLRLVQTLFRQYDFKVLIIESIPNSSGESPKWFIDQAKKGNSETFIKGGESALAAILADERKIPFFAGEPDDQEIFTALKAKGYTDEDIIAFYAVRQIPQWVREKEEKAHLLERNIPPFVTHYCKGLAIASCPTYADIAKWYKSHLGHELNSDLPNEELAPYSDGKLFTQKISSDIGYVRDHFALNIIQTMLEKYHKVAVVYGAGHFLTLRKSFDAALGEPEFIEDFK